MVSEFVSQYATAARFDYLKFSFPDTHPIHRQQVDEVLSHALGLVSEKYGLSSLVPPKMTTLPPSPAKPNGKYIVELWGGAAMLVMYLPRHWLEFVTYVHVKSYIAQPGGVGIERVDELMRDTEGLLTYTFTKPGRANNSPVKAREPGARLGSRKSGAHFSLYARPGQLVGLEGRFRDEFVKDIASECYELGAKHDIGDTGAWQTALYRWARLAGEKFCHELYRRELDPHEFGYPVTYEEMSRGDTYERRADLHEREKRHYWGD